MKKKAVIDIGSLKLKVAIFNTEQRVLLSSASYLTLLGKGIEDTGHITEESLKKLDEALATVAGELKDASIDDTVIIGTEALRRATNIRSVRALIGRHFPGSRLKVVEQHREAELFFKAVSREFPDKLIVAVDVGGGSVQVVEGSYSSKTGRAHVSKKFNLPEGTYKLQQRYSPRNDVVSSKLEEAWVRIQAMYHEVDSDAPILVFGSTCMLDFVKAAKVPAVDYAASPTHPISVQEAELSKLLGSLKVLEPENRSHFYPDGGYFMYGADYLLMHVLAAAQRIRPEHIIPTNLNSSYAFI